MSEGPKTLTLKDKLTDATIKQLSALFEVASEELTRPYVAAIERKNVEIAKLREQLAQATAQIQKLTIEAGANPS